MGIDDEQKTPQWVEKSHPPVSKGLAMGVATMSAARFLKRIPEAERRIGPDEPGINTPVDINFLRTLTANGQILPEEDLTGYAIYLEQRMEPDMFKSLLEAQLEWQSTTDHQRGR